MMAASFLFELVSPEALLLSKPAAMVAIPGGEGDYAVLPDHAPMMTSVRCGVIDVYEADEHTVADRIFVAGGFAEVTGERCTVLAEEAVQLASMDRAQLEEQARNLGEDLGFAATDVAKADIQARMDKVKLKLRFLSGEAA